ncbi:FYVE, RhoGEF and PH domain-containing protein 6 [Zootermopsis nevadensis]|uniref:FYVE, RhoGEF and PH domain-containing protein 6 n=1 Tax=Zootermopsis nevadensis TaxID=136037 RepID=A0A067R6Z5_ZOONE|nr:FYVE, RhoGEF and PH domain-containing protein 6 [Zootermopsis nevadensis]
MAVMAAIPGKRKPPTPPKPSLHHLAGPNLEEGHGDPSKERYVSNLQREGKAKNNHIYDEIVNACKETVVEKKISKLKTKTDNTSDAAVREKTYGADVIKCNSDKHSPKPPLLPKPQTSPKLLNSFLRLGPANTRPFISKRLSLVLPTARNGKELTVGSENEITFLTSTVGNYDGESAIKRLPVHIKAPVAKLEEFENFCDSVKSESPVRPPRSPKHQPFKGEPFTVFEHKPELPLKKKQWNCNAASPVLASGADFEALQLHWQNMKRKSASLGRSDAFRFIEGQTKCASLERGKITDFVSYVANEEELPSLRAKNAPIPPPRQKKKQCGHSHSIPVYAEVNYSLKKNRRQAAEEPKECSEYDIDGNEEGVQEQMAVIQGKLVLPGPKNDTLVSKVEGLVLDEHTEGGECFQEIVVCDNTENMKESKKIEVVNEVSVCREDVDEVVKFETLNLVDLNNGCVISQDNILNSTDLDCATEDNNDSISSFLVDNRTSGTNGRISPVVVMEVMSHAEESLTSSLLLAHAEEKQSGSSLECFSVEPQKESIPGKVEEQSSKISHNVSIVDGAEHLAIEGNSSPIIHPGIADFSESVTAVVIDSESAESVKNNIDISLHSSVNNVEVSCTDLVIVKEIEVTSQVEADVSQNVDSANSDYRLSASSLPVRRKLEMKESGKFLRRRQSWSNCKDDSPSPEKTTHCIPSTHKHKSKSCSWWCDEGDLSSGVLGDLDSSDTTARQSSYEEVDWTGSDFEDGPNPVRSKLSTLLGSLGKGNQKKKTKKDSNSQFYCDNRENCDQKLREEDQEREQIPVLKVTEIPAAEVQEIEINGFNSTVPDGSRPPSGLSTLSALDIDQRSDAPVSEDSFEIYQHSESENEAEINLEDRDANQTQSVETHHEKKAFYIAEELMTSERVFIDVLKLLNVDFRQAVHAVGAEQKYPVIPGAELDKILNSLPQLQSFNEDLLRDLKHRIDNWDCIKKIADVIVRKGPFLKLYTSYIQNFESQCIYLEECCQKYPKFAKVVKEFEASPRCQKLSLKHYMLKPVQRIPQYRLLLEDYLRHLSPSSPDLDDTQTALKIVCDVADHANRSIKQGDHLSKLLQLQSQLGNYEIIKPGRVFLKDGELFKLSRKGVQPRYFILLNDCLLYTSYYGSVQSSGLKMNYELPLNSMKVSIPQAEDYHNEFSIISVKRSFTLSARSLNERQEWVDALHKAITDYTSRQLSFQNIKITSSPKNEDSSEPFRLGQELSIYDVLVDAKITLKISCA